MLQHGTSFGSATDIYIHCSHGKKFFLKFQGLVVLIKKIAFIKIGDLFEGKTAPGQLSFGFIL